MSKLGERASEVYKKTKSLEKRDKFLHKILRSTGRIAGITIKK